MMNMNMKKNEGTVREMKEEEEMDPRAWVGEKLL